MSRWLIPVCALVLASSPLRALADDVKLGFVDLQRALNETDDGRKAKAKLKKEFDQRQKELDEQQEQWKKDYEDFRKKQTLLPPETARQKEAELQERLQKLQQTFVRHQQNLTTKQDEETGKIFERMSRIIGKIATAENFTMVLDRNQGVVFAKPHLDLTNELIRRYNAGEGAGPATAGGGAAPPTSAAKGTATPKK